MAEPLPLVILAGSDRRRGSVPPGMQAADMLVGYKGAFRLPGGRPLVAEVIERFLSSGRFEQPILIGPSRIYSELELPCQVVDSEGPLSSTLKAATRTVTERFALDRPIAFTACDILPSAEELTALMSDAYDPFARSVFWTQLVAASAEQMGASGWKPGYALAAGPARMMNVYPGHLVVLRPNALRFPIMFRLLELAYRYRNRPLWQRALGMTMQGVGALMAQDFGSLMHARPSLLSLSIPFHCVASYLRYRSGHFGVSDLERVFAKVFLHRGAQVDHGNRPVVFAITRALSLAKDIDTRAELDELTAR